MDEVRGKGSYSDDEDDSSSLRASLHSPRSDEDDFPRFLSQENESRIPFPPLRINTDEDVSFRREETPKGGCSPLVQSFSRIDFRENVAFLATSPMISRATNSAVREVSAQRVLSVGGPIEPAENSHILALASTAISAVVTPSRRRSSSVVFDDRSFYEERDFNFTKKGFTPTSQVRFSRRESKAFQTPTSNAEPICAESPSHFSYKRISNETSRNQRLSVPADSPLRHAFSNGVKHEEGKPADHLDDVSGFAARPPPRPCSPPSRPPRHKGNRRSSFEPLPELVPSPARVPDYNWRDHRPSSSGTPHQEVGAFLRDMTSPIPRETGHGSLTPNEPKNMVAPRRPRKRTGPPCNRVILNSPVPTGGTASTARHIEDIPELAPEAKPTASTAETAEDSNERGNKLMRRHSTVDSSEIEAPGLLHRSQTAPLPTRSLSAAMKQSPEDERIERGRCKSLIGTLLQKGIKLLCLDWDLTVIAIHTHSQWFGPVSELARWIRPVFRNLIDAALRTPMRIGFVSFSGQTREIHDALRITFGDSGFREGQFVVRCSDKQWEAEKEQFADLFPRAKNTATTKLSHICSVVSFFSSSTDKENSNPQTQNIRPEHIVFIDDDLKNVREVSANDVQSFAMDPVCPDKFLDLLENWCELPLPSPPLSLHMADC